MVADVGLVLPGRLLFVGVFWCGTSGVGGCCLGTLLGPEDSGCLFVLCVGVGGGWFLLQAGWVVLRVGGGVVGCCP